MISLGTLTDSTTRRAWAPGSSRPSSPCGSCSGRSCDWLTTTYTFTNRRFIKRSGLIAKEGRTIPLNRISGVDFEIGVIDRLFGCGTLIVSDASTNGRVLLDDIPQVEQVQLQVAEELHTLAHGGRAERVDDGT